MFKRSNNGHVKTNTLYVFYSDASVNFFTNFQKKPPLVQALILRESRYFIVSNVKCQTRPN